MYQQQLLPSTSSQLPLVPLINNLTHNNRPSINSFTPRRPARPITKCDRCRSRKSRCDSGQPCESCLKSKAICEYTDGRPTWVIKTIIRQSHLQISLIFSYTARAFQKEAYPSTPTQMSLINWLLARFHWRKTVIIWWKKLISYRGFSMMSQLVKPYKPMDLTSPFRIVTLPPHVTLVSVSTSKLITSSLISQSYGSEKSPIKASSKPPILH